MLLLLLFAYLLLAIHFVKGIIYANIGGHYLDITNLVSVVIKKKESGENSFNPILLDSLVSNNEANSDLHLVFNPKTHAILVVPGTSNTVELIRSGTNLVKESNASPQYISKCLEALPGILGGLTTKRYRWLDFRWALPSEFAQIPLAVLKEMFDDDRENLIFQLFGLVSRTGLLDLLYTINFASNGNSSEHVLFILELLGQNCLTEERICAKAENLNYEKSSLLSSYGDKLLPLIPAATFFGLSGASETHHAITSYYKEVVRTSNRGVVDVTNIPTTAIARWLVPILLRCREGIKRAAKKELNDSENIENFANALGKVIAGNEQLGFEAHRDFLASMGLYREDMFSTRSFTDILSYERILDHLKWQLVNLDKISLTQGQPCMTVFLGLGLLDPARLQISHLQVIREIFESLSVAQLLEWNVLAQFLFLFLASPAVYEASDKSEAFHLWITTMVKHLSEKSAISDAITETLPRLTRFLQPIDVPEKSNDNNGAPNEFYRCIGLDALNISVQILGDPSLPRDLLPSFYVYSRSLMQEAPMLLAKRLGIEAVLELIAPHEELLLRFGLALRPLSVALEYQKTCWTSHYESTFRRLIGTFILLPLRGLHLSIRKHNWTPELDGLFTRRETLHVSLARAFIDGLIEDVRELFGCNHIPTNTNEQDQKQPQSSSSSGSGYSRSAPETSFSGPPASRAITLSSVSSPPQKQPPVQPQQLGFLSRIYRNTVDVCSGYYSYHKQVKAAIKVLARAIIDHPYLLDLISLHRLLYDPVLPKNYSEYANLEQIYQSRANYDEFNS